VASSVAPPGVKSIHEPRVTGQVGQSELAGLPFVTYIECGFTR